MKQSLINVVTLPILDKNAIVSHSENYSKKDLKNYDTLTNSLIWKEYVSKKGEHKKKFSDSLKTYIELNYDEFFNKGFFVIVKRVVESNNDYPDTMGYYLFINEEFDKYLVEHFEDSFENNTYKLDLEKLIEKTRIMSDGSDPKDLQGLLMRLTQKQRDWIYLENFLPMNQSQSWFAYKELNGDHIKKFSKYIKEICIKHPEYFESNDFVSFNTKSSKKHMFSERFLFISPALDKKLTKEINPKYKYKEIKIKEIAYGFLKEVREKRLKNKLTKWQLDFIFQCISMEHLKETDKSLYKELKEDYKNV